MPDPGQRRHIHDHVPSATVGARGYTRTTHHAGHLTPGDWWQPDPGRYPRTVTDIHRRHGVIVLTDQYGTTWTYPANAVIPTAVPDPLPIHTSTTADGGTRSPAMLGIPLDGLRSPVTTPDHHPPPSNIPTTPR